MWFRLVRVGIGYLPVCCIHPKIDRIEQNILQLSGIVDPEKRGYTRVSFSPEDLQARDLVRRWMEKEASLAVRVDAAGNMIGRRKGKREVPAIMIGSHIDTVPGGGRFDGVAGVVAGLEVARCIEEEHIDLQSPLEIVVFLAEETSPFGMTTLGSRAMAGTLSPDLLEKLRDRTGRTLSQGLAQMGGRPSSLKEAQRPAGTIHTFLELHIEQGPVLASKGIDIGIVTGIAGIHRGTVEVFGTPDHSGTTPMESRKDALCAAAEAVLALERTCREIGGVVGTVGKIEASPNAANVVMGRVLLECEMRSLRKDSIGAAWDGFERSLDHIRKTRNIDVRAEIHMSSGHVDFDCSVIKRISDICHALGFSCQEMPSMAGHDAGHMAAIAPASMVFVPSLAGRSHCPEEWSDFAAIGKGAQVLGAFVTSDPLSHFGLFLG